jgi:hypothetical protein
MLGAARGLPHVSGSSIQGGVAAGCWRDLQAGQRWVCGAAGLLQPGLLLAWLAVGVARAAGLLLCAQCSLVSAQGNHAAQRLQPRRGRVTGSICSHGLSPRVTAHSVV